ncbi:TetR/AcrR family transcriptional regulator C-terminal domain-containing protein [Streptomyces sp. SID3343]|uniref:TetR/AcrR family transcriptional regulator C-terminal domain-containing protein n=1 Tax=Streptomyces sp. SID3343 TaxID=2690260 RepID=UPI0013687522|nr:TetR/AcrR family transcriptional regulator C-terminal domain-containing protein [Streptomyces sp. SID3343]MYW01613.1 TetR family transcriptional regulator [Streptomyces sp. SID3343]
MLRRADVVDGAIALLDSEGLDGLTTRKLGLALNVRGPALYRHFPSKEALLDAMADRLLEAVAAPLPARPWDEQLSFLAGRMRAALLSHRDGARVVAGTYVTGPNTRLIEDAIFEILQAAEFPAARAGWVAFALGHYVLGHTIEEQAQAQLSAAGVWQARKDALSGRPDSRYARTALTEAFDADPAERFDYGVRLFIDGVRRELLDAPPRSVN